MPPIPVHPTPWGTPPLAIWAKLNTTVLQTRANRFWLELWPTGPEVVLDIFLFRPNCTNLLPMGLASSPHNLVMIAAAAPEIWGLMTFK